MESQAELEKMGAPYPSQVAGLGGLPTILPDVPICAVFLTLYLIGAASHMTILQVNLRRSHKFIMSGLLFGFSMARIVTMIMRIVWARFPHDVRVGIAAGIFINAGVLILFIVNLIFTQRILRAAHPHIGWSKGLKVLFTVLYAGIGLMLCMVIASTVQSFYTLKPHDHRIDLDLQRTASCYLLFVAFLPIPLILFGLVLPRKTRLEKFGTGRWRTKVRILLLASALLTTGAGFRTGTAFMSPRPRTHPYWFDSKACLYIFDFTLEIIVLYLYVVVRVDKRFYVPDHAKGPGDYNPERMAAGEAGSAEADGPTGDSDRSSFVRGHRIMSEEEVFDDEKTINDNDGGSRPMSKEGMGMESGSSGPVSPV